MPNPFTWLRSLFSGRQDPRSLRDLDVGDLLASLRDGLPDLSLPKGLSPNGVYLGGVWLLDREQPEQRNEAPTALVFYGEAFYTALQVAKSQGTPPPTLRAGFTYELDGDRMTVEQLAQDGNGGGDGADGGEDERETIAWRYETGRLLLGDSHSYRPSDLAELIAEGFDAEVVKFVEILARSADRDFRERVDALPLRSAQG